MNKSKSNRNIPEKLLGEKVIVINVGLATFEDSLKQQGVQVISVHFVPSHELPPDLESILNRIL